MLCHRCQHTLWTASVSQKGRPPIPASLLDPPVLAGQRELERFPVESLRGYVSSITHEGAFIDVGAEVEGWVHVSLLSDEYVRDPFTFLTVGEEVQTIVTSIVNTAVGNLASRSASTSGVAPLPSRQASSRLYLSMAPSKMRLRPQRPADKEVEAIGT
eukprot:g13831.t1